MSTNCLALRQSRKQNWLPGTRPARSTCLRRPAMFVLERVLGKKQPVGAPAHRGSAVEDGVTMGLNNMKASVPSCVNVALTKYDTLTALSQRPAQSRSTAR